MRPAAEAEKFGFVGEIERVNVDVIDHIAEDYVPVIASVGTDREGRSYNINADEAAGKVAAAMRAHKAIFLTDVDGWLRDPADPGSRISQAPRSEVRRRWTVEGGMRPKLAACVEAIGGGVEAAHIIDGRQPHSLLLELFTDAGIGTKITAMSAVSSSELQELEARWVMPTYRRAPGRVRARRGGAALGLRRARSTSTSWPGSRSARSGTAIPPWSRRSASRRGR